jgi:hypothetical protein
MADCSPVAAMLFLIYQGCLPVFVPDAIPQADVAVVK